MSWIDWIKNLWHPKRGRDPTGDGLTAVPPGEGERVRVRLRAGVATTVGNYREHNEDNYYLPGVGTIADHAEGPPSTSAGTLEPAASADGNGRQRPGPAAAGELEVDGPFIVADGMGGQLAGEQASRIAVEVIPKELRGRPVGGADDPAAKEAIRAAIAAANREIIAQAHVMPECSNMGTTVVVALFRPGRAYIAGIGDSRAYRLRGPKLERLTRDHDLATALITAGTIRPDEADKHQFRHVLYLYLGSPEARDGPEDIGVVDLKPGDRYLLASDGLTGVVDDGAVAEVLGRVDDPQRAARELVTQALGNDSRDNVTCMVIYAD